MTARKSARTSKVVVWGGLGVGLVASTAFNVISVAITSGKPVAMIMSGVWPLALTLAVEIMVRVPFPKGRMWTVARLGGVGSVAALAMVISFSHIHHVMIHWGESPVTAIAAPLVLDGLMTLSGAALLAMHAPKPTTRRRTTRKPATKPQAKKLQAV